MLSKNQLLFVEWLKKNNPAIYARAKRAAGKTATLSAADTAPTTTGGGWWDSFISAAKDLVPVVLQAQSQRKILDVQVSRAQQGLAPLNTEQIAPTVLVQAGLSPNLRRIMLPALGIGALLLYFVMSKKKRR